VFPENFDPLPFSNEVKIILILAFVIRLVAAGSIVVGPIAAKLFGPQVDDL
jgi:hypothetical protein